MGSDKEIVINDGRRVLSRDFRVSLASDAASCLKAFQQKRHEFAFVDVDFLGGVGEAENSSKLQELLQPYREAFPSVPIVILAPPERTRSAVAFVRAGASDYLTYPLSGEQMALVMDSILEEQRLKSELDHLRGKQLLSDMGDYTRTDSPAMREVLEKIMTVAPTRTTVLLIGETGTGKGVASKLIHALSHRSKKPFISVHCGAIPDTLLESELFGHEKGAFTGAIRRKFGKFQLAHGGTIFLDELSTLSASAQIKLLQVLQEKTFSMVGGDADISVDVRIVGASNSDLKEICETGTFRKDLYYRLSVFPIQMPPLRDRIEDIPLLIDFFLKRLNREYEKDIRGVEEEVLEALKHYPWPGNIRELENVIERAYILEKTNQLSWAGFPMEIVTLRFVQSGANAGSTPTLADVRQRAVERAEALYLQEILSLSNGRVDRSASMAGVTARQLYNLMMKYGIRKEKFKDQEK